MSVRPIPPQTVFSATVSSGTTHQSVAFNLSNMFSACAAYIVNVGAGLTATYQLMVSMDNVTFYDSGQALPSTTGAAKIFTVQYNGSFPYVCMQITYGSGSGSVTITGSAKGGA